MNAPGVKSASRRVHKLNRGRHVRLTGEAEVRRALSAAWALCMVPSWELPFSVTQRSKPTQKSKIHLATLAFLPNLGGTKVVLCFLTTRCPITQVLRTFNNRLRHAHLLNMGLYGLCINGQPAEATGPSSLISPLLSLPAPSNFKPPPIFLPTNHHVLEQV
jgi:hypothetical protein